MTHYYKITYRLDVLITSLKGKMFPFLSNENFSVFLLVDQTPSELILVAASDFGFVDHALLENVIDSLGDAFAFVFRREVIMENITVEEVDQVEFFWLLRGYDSFINWELFTEPDLCD